MKIGAYRPPSTRRAAHSSASCCVDGAVKKLAIAGILFFGCVQRALKDIEHKKAHLIHQEHCEGGGVGTDTVPLQYIWTAGTPAAGAARGGDRDCKGGRNSQKNTEEGTHAETRGLVNV